MRSVEFLIIGGGASGMVAAIEALRAGKKTLIIEKNKKLGKKLLATGNGRCNFTNLIQTPECYRSRKSPIAFQAIREFGAPETIEWFKEIGILPFEKEGYIYPASLQANAVLQALTEELCYLNAEVHTEETVLSVSKHRSEKNKKTDGYLVKTDINSYLAHNLLISTGGTASPVHGSSGDGFLFAKSLGHSVLKSLPALTSLILEGNYMKGWAGNRLRGEVWLEDESGSVLAKEHGEIQLVSYGVSGIPVFQISHFAAEALEKHTKVFFCMDSFLSLTKEQLFAEIMKNKGRALSFRRQWESDTKPVDALCRGFLPDKFAKTISRLVFGTTGVEKITDAQIKKFVSMIKEFRAPVKATSAFDKAQVSSGGIPLEEISLDTFESQKNPYLYFAGEVLDVDGICGGYNLQWAWTSGITAGRAVGKTKREGYGK